MKKILIKLLFWLVKENPKEVVQIDKLRLIRGEVISNVELICWDYNHNGVLDFKIKMWYKDIRHHVMVEDLNKEEAVALYTLALNFIGKEIK